MDDELDLRGLIFFQQEISLVSRGFSRRYQGSQMNYSLVGKVQLVPLLGVLSRKGVRREGCPDDGELGKAGKGRGM